mgnify:CR=1 FL=1
MRKRAIIPDGVHRSCDWSDLRAGKLSASRWRCLRGRRHASPWCPINTGLPAVHHARIEYPRAFWAGRLFDARFGERRLGSGRGQEPQYGGGFVGQPGATHERSIVACGVLHFARQWGYESQSLVGE